MFFAIHLKRDENFLPYFQHLKNVSITQNKVIISTDATSSVGLILNTIIIRFISVSCKWQRTNFVVLE